MVKVFLTILNMSLTGTFAVAAICLARLSIKKAPKIISYYLWAAAGFRFAFPFAIESVFGLIPFKAYFIPPDYTEHSFDRIGCGAPFVNNPAGGALSAQQAMSWAESGKVKAV